MKNHCYSQLMKGVQQLLFFKVLAPLQTSTSSPPNLHLVPCQTQDRSDLLIGVVLSEGLHGIKCRVCKSDAFVGVTQMLFQKVCNNKKTSILCSPGIVAGSLWLLMWRCPWQFCSNAPFVWRFFFFLSPLPEHTGSHNWARFCICSCFPTPAWIHACAASPASQTTVNQL